MPSFCSDRTVVRTERSIWLLGASLCCFYYVFGCNRRIGYNNDSTKTAVKQLLGESTTSGFQTYSYGYKHMMIIAIYN